SRPRKIYDNSELVQIMKGYSYLNQLTNEGQKIISDAIDSVLSSSRNKVSKKVIFKMVCKIESLSTSEVESFLNFEKQFKGEKKLAKSSIYNYRNIAHRAAVELLEAYNHGVMIKYTLNGDARNLTSDETNKLKQMLHDGTSLMRIKAYINSL
ncbi:hypothetical protein EJW63_22130, partial [Salmonella enterica subsp. enterica serovar Meleagridis]|nr:hypothetical protein [Salmonella enterica subsp. enterica serovar Meleagridis]EHL1896273.1 hypothetical protein [Salmonella enterica subsp. enterica serovar Infantis]EKJ9415970.1 hypothetical protein [Salmonella enterica]